MVQVRTETVHAEEFLFSEGTGNISRDKDNVNANQNLQAGTILARSSGDLIAHPGTTNTAATALLTPVVGVLSFDVNTTSTGPWGNADSPPQAYISRNAEVVDALLTFPAVSDAAKNLMRTSLATLGIIVR